MALHPPLRATECDPANPYRSAQFKLRITHLFMQTLVMNRNKFVGKKEGKRFEWYAL